MKLSKNKIEALKEIESKFGPNMKMWATGYSLPHITGALAEVLGKTGVVIKVPYSNFVCRGTANDVDSDVKGLMPFSKTRKSEDECTTLFYGETPIDKKNYIPFQGGCDVFYVSKINITAYWVEVELVKAPHVGMFM